MLQRLDTLKICERNNVGYFRQVFFCHRYNNTAAEISSNNENTVYKNREDYEPGNLKVTITSINRHRREQRL